MSDPAPALTGMTWEHPRAYQGLEAFAALADAPAVAWDRQPLAAFEAHPITDLAARYDLMVIDHPGLGTAIGPDGDAGSLLPLEEVVAPAFLDHVAASTVGSSARSYRLAGHTWALPIDAAAQVAVRRHDAPAVPSRWEEVLDAAGRSPVTLCLGGPHAMLMLLALCSDKPAAPGTLLDEGAALGAIALMRAVHAVADPEVSLLDPIGVHEAIAAGSGPAWCPLAYGYVSYARPAPGAARLAWSDAPSWGGGGPLSVLGGTGLAVSARARRNAAVSAWVEAFLADDVQTSLVPTAGGQPAHARVWDGTAEVDAQWGGFYTATAATLATAWVRPRSAGWIAVQEHGSELVREAVLAEADPAAVVARINADAAALAADLGEPDPAAVPAGAATLAAATRSHR